MAMVAEMGDCFGSDAECQPFWDAESVHIRGLIVLVVGLTVVGFAAIAVGRQLVPAVLLVASSSAFFLGVAEIEGLGAVLWWVPRGMFVTLPATLVLGLASAGQVIERFNWRRGAGRRSSDITNAD
jgi:uncharacterized protein (DUF697 family)